MLIGQFLPITAAGRDYVAFNCTQLVSDALADDAQVVRFDSGRVMTIERYSFVEDRVADYDVFKLAEHPRGPLLFSAAAVERLEQTGLTGLSFDLLGECSSSPGV